MQDKQNEACYLQEHKEDLIEELATTIVQKVWHAFFPSLFNSQITMFYSSNSANNKKDDTNIESKVNGLWQYRLHQLCLTEISL